MTSRDLRTYLEVYLHDHHAGAIGALELIGRMIGAARGEPAYEEFLRWLRDDIRRDLDALEAQMDRMGIERSRAKDGMSWLAEKLGRLEMNGRTAGQSPLSRVLELEALTGAINAKNRLWATLEAMGPMEPRLDGAELARLIEVAHRQIEEVGRWHGEAVRRLVSGADAEDV